MWSLMQKPSVSYRKCIAKNKGKIDLPKMRGRFDVKYMCIMKAILALICSDRNVFIGK